MKALHSPLAQLRRQWLRLPLLDRWLTSELIAPLLFGIAAFTAVSLSVGVVFELVRMVAESGMPLLAAGQVLALRLPGFLVLSAFSLLMLVVMRKMQLRWTRTWAEKGGRARHGAGSVSVAAGKAASTAAAR